MHPPPARSGEVRVSAEPQPVGWAFIALYAAAYVGTCLVLIAPLLVTLTLKVDAVVGSDQAPNSLAWSPGSAPWRRCSATRSSAS